MLVFEDKESTGLSELVRSIYGDKVYFTAGNRLIEQKFDEWYCASEMNIIFIDVVPGKAPTLDIYYSLCSLSKCYKNICVIPVPCMEYFAIKAFKGDKDTENIKIVLNRENHYNTNLVQVIHRGKRLDFEKYCKSVFEHEFPLCMHNVNLKESKSEVEGKYYRGDCNCYKGCAGNPLKFEQKARYLVCQLPCYVDTGQNICSMFDNKISEKVRKEYIVKYNQQVKLLEDAGEILKGAWYIDSSETFDMEKSYMSSEPSQSNSTADELNELVKELHS